MIHIVLISSCMLPLPVLNLNFMFNSDVAIGLMFNPHQLRGPLPFKAIVLK